MLTFQGGYCATWCAGARVFYRVGVCQYPLVDILEYPFVDTYIYDVRFILLTKGKPSRPATQRSKSHVRTSNRIERLSYSNEGCQ